MLLYIILHHFCSLMMYDANSKQVSGFQLTIKVFASGIKLGMFEVSKTDRVVRTNHLEDAHNEFPHVLVLYRIDIPDDIYGRYDDESEFLISIAVRTDATSTSMVEPFTDSPVSKNNTSTADHSGQALIKALFNPVQLGKKRTARLRQKFGAQRRLYDCRRNATARIKTDATCKQHIFAFPTKIYLSDELGQKETLQSYERAHWLDAICRGGEPFIVVSMRQEAGKAPTSVTVSENSIPKLSIVSKMKKVDQLG